MESKLTNLDELERLGFKKTEIYEGSFGQIQVYQKESRGCLYYVDMDLILINFELKPKVIRTLSYPCRRVRGIWE